MSLISRILSQTFTKAPPYENSILNFSYGARHYRRAFFCYEFFLILFGFLTARLHSAQPSSGTLNPGGSQLNWVGTAVGGGSIDESTCVEGVNCDTFTLTLSGTLTNWSGLKARIVVSCADPSGVSDYDVYVH